MAIDTFRGFPRHDGTDGYVNDDLRLVPETEKLGAHWEALRRREAEFVVSRLRSAASSDARWVDQLMDETGVVAGWRVFTPDGMVSIFGTSPANRVADPDDPSRIAEWLVEAQYDRSGNSIVYEWAADDDEVVDRGAVFEQGRLGRPSAALPRRPHGALRLVGSKLPRLLTTGRSR